MSRPCATRPLPSNAHDPIAHLWALSEPFDALPGAASSADMGGDARERDAVDDGSGFGTAQRLFDARCSLDERLACAAAAAVGGLGDTEVLRDHLMRGSDDDRLVAATALASPRHATAVPALLETLTTDDATPAVRAAAVVALTAMSPAGIHSELVDVLARAADAADAEVRRAAVSAASCLVSPMEACTLLMRASHDAEARVRCSALVGWNMLGRACASSVVVWGALRAAEKGICDDDVDVRRTAAVVLATCFHPRARQVLRRCLTDADAAVRRAALAGLTELSETMELDLPSQSDAGRVGCQSAAWERFEDPYPDMVRSQQRVAGVTSCGAPARVPDGASNAASSLRRPRRDGWTDLARSRGLDGPRLMESHVCVRRTSRR